MDPTGPRQLPLSLEHAPRFGFDDYLVTPSNEAAHRLITSWPDWPGRGVLLVGPVGSGKTHLATIWARTANAHVVEAAGLSEADLPGLGASAALVVENLGRDDASERLLFHLLNAARERNQWVLLTAAQGPDLVWPALPDLSSRLRALTRAELAAPDDALFRAVLVKLLMDRQLAVEGEVVDYVARRVERSLAAARRIVAAIDAEALSRGRRVTRALAASVLAREGDGGEE